jgi:hypothetical protein
MRPLIGLWQALSMLGEPFQAGSFWTWKTVAKLIDGIPLRDEKEIELFRQCSGRRQLLTKPARRLILLVGRRGGKDRFMSAVAVWRASAMRGLAQTIAPASRRW